MADFANIGSNTFETVSEVAGHTRKTVVGNSRSTNFEPHLEVIPWDGVSFKFWKDTSASLGESANVSDHEKLIWQDSKEQYDFSRIETDLPEQLKDIDKNGAKFVSLMTEKPSMGSDGFARFDYHMSGHENLRFLYQPPLTPTIEDPGPVFKRTRPDYVVGSYSIRHKTDRNNECMNGKVCHLYPPFCVDNLGNFTFGKWELDEGSGLLTKCLPDVAFSYPGATSWRGDIILGDNTKGGSSDGFFDDYIFVWPIGSPASSGAISKIGAITGPACTGILVVYDDVAGTPTNLIDRTNEIVTTEDVANSFVNQLAASVDSAKSYWGGVWFDDPNNPTIWYDADSDVASYDSFDYSDNTPNPSDPIVVGGTIGDAGQYNVWLEYVAAGGLSIMNQLQTTNLGADLYNGTLL